MMEMGENHPQWAEKYKTISKLMDLQTAELRLLFRKVLMMRYETSLLGLKYLKTTKLLQQIKEEIDNLDSE